MNNENTKVADPQMVQPLPINYEGLDFSWIGFLLKILVLLFGLGLILILIIVKSKTTAEFFAEPILYSYTIFISVFVLSRLVSAMIFEGLAREMLVPTKKYPTIFPSRDPLVTIVIPCKNEEKSISTTIEQCSLAHYPKDKLEIIVINDGSTDNTGQMLEEWKQRLDNLQVIHWEKNRGKRPAMAAGFRMAKGEIIVQLDSDSYFDPVNFRNLIVPFANQEISAVCAHTDPQNADQNMLTRMQSAYYFMSFRILKAAESAYLSVLCCSGCSSAYRTSAVLPLLDDWVNEKFLGLPATWGDDRALTSRILKNGGKTIYTNQVKAYTVVPDNWKQLLTQQLRWKKSWIVNSIYLSRFIWKTNPFIAFFYFYPLILISFLTPIITFRALFYLPIVEETYPIVHFLGVMLLTALFAVYYKLVGKGNKFWPYLFLWSIFNFFVLSLMMFYAALRIQDRGWGTR